MRIVGRTLILAFSVLLSTLAAAVYRPHQDVWQNAATWGDASPEVRTAVIAQLNAFQDGYTRRDPSRATTFMDRLFSRERPVVLGTMPGEIDVGYDAASQLVKSDWESWGDVRFRTAETHVSAAGDVAWFATAGSVTFDLSRFLVVPLRLSGVMVRENGAWKMRQAQFQFDLDFSALLVLQILLLGWVGVSVIWLLVAIYRSRSSGRRPNVFSNTTDRSRMQPS